MILVICGCCGMASGYGCAVWCAYGATGVQGNTPALYEAGGGATYGRTVSRFVLPQDRGLEYGSLKSPLTKILGDYYSHFIGI